MTSNSAFPIIPNPAVGGAGVMVVVGVDLVESEEEEVVLSDLGETGAAGIVTDVGSEVEDG